MGHLPTPQPVLLVVAVFSRHPEALTWAEERLVAHFGTVALASLTYDFDQTTYYQAEMGSDLKKRLLAFERLVPQDILANAKALTNRLEEELAASGRFAEPRPVNLDPGFLTLTKLQLASTKDQAHRVYLKDGIYAEGTLRFASGEFVPWPWTYADYHLPQVLAFLKLARDYYRHRQRKGNER